MSFTCYGCYARDALLRLERLSPDEAVARDALIEGRVASDTKDGVVVALTLTIRSDNYEKAITILTSSGLSRAAAHKRAGDLVMLKTETEIPPYRSVGAHEAWPGEEVWLPSLGVSVGPCEDCGNERPCVNT